MRLNYRWRLLALLSLVLYVVLVVIIATLLIQNLILIVIFGVTSLLLAYSLWLIFAGTTKDEKIGIWLGGVASLALVAELLYFLIDQKNRRALLLIALLTVLYLILFGVLRRKYWTIMREEAELSESTAKFKKPYLIINPVSGNGRAIKAHIDELAEKMGIKVIMTKKGVDISESALKAVRAGADVLGISGGDGSIGAVAKIAMEHNLPIVVLPGGTRCHFARDLGLDPKRIIDSLQGFNGLEKRIDVGDINGRIFLNNASFGLYADIVNHEEYRDNKLQVTRKVLQDIVSEKKKPYDLQFTAGKTKIKHAILTVVGVNQYNTMSLLELGQRDQLDEGVIQVTIVTKLNNKLVKELLSIVSFKRPTSRREVEGISQWVGKSLVVDSKSKKLVVGVDGESEDYQTPVKIKILPGALRIYLPAEGVRSRPKNPFSMAIIKEIVQNIR